MDRRRFLSLLGAAGALLLLPEPFWGKAFSLPSEFTGNGAYVDPEWIAQQFGPVLADVMFKPSPAFWAMTKKGIRGLGTDIRFPILGGPVEYLE